ncbi:hypothetical protein [Sinorhizobium fredii]|nr:hypothetical protein [Sinorhizobium fredii]
MGVSFYEILKLAVDGRRSIPKDGRGAQPAKIRRIGEYRLGISGRLKGEGPYESIGQTGDSFPSAVVLV